MIRKINAFVLGFIEHIGEESDMGRTYADMDLNEAYDHGWKLADRMRGRGDVE